MTSLISKTVCMSRRTLLIGPKIEHYFVIIFLFFNFLKVAFDWNMLKEWNFLHVADLSFDERLVKYYHFNLRFHEGFFHKNNLVQPQTLAPPNIWNYGNICTISNVVFSAVVFSFSTDFFSVSYCVKFSYNTYLLKNVEKIKIDKFRLNLSLWKEIFPRNPLNEP